MPRVRTRLVRTRRDTPGMLSTGGSRLAVIASLAAVLGCAAGHAAPAPAPAPQPVAAAGRSAAGDTTPPAGMLSVPNANPFPSTYAPFASRTTLIRGATILTASGPVLHDASILLRDGKIVAVGAIGRMLRPMPS